VTPAAFRSSPTTTQDSGAGQSRYRWVASDVMGHDEVGGGLDGGFGGKVALACRTATYGLRATKKNFLFFKAPTVHRRRARRENDGRPVDEKVRDNSWGRARYQLLLGKRAPGADRSDVFIFYRGEMFYFISNDSDCIPGHHPGAVFG